MYTICSNMRESAFSIMSSVVCDNLTQKEAQLCTFSWHNALISLYTQYSYHSYPISVTDMMYTVTKVLLDNGLGLLISFIVSCSSFSLRFHTIRYFLYTRRSVLDVIVLVVDLILMITVVKYGKLHFYIQNQNWVKRKELLLLSLPLLIFRLCMLLTTDWLTYCIYTWTSLVLLYVNFDLIYNLS